MGTSMRGVSVLGAIVLATAFVTGASAQDKPTVQSLIGQGFQIVGTIATQVGPGVFLQNKDKAFFCLVAETSTSSDVATRYCKPLH